MKRSEMVKIIADELWKILPSELCKYVDMDASRILRLIEEHGMTPPKDASSCDFYAKELGYDDYNHYLEMNEDNFMGEWEREE